MPRRLTVSLLVCLLIGTLASIGIAWTMSLAARPRQWEGSTTAVSSRGSFGRFDVQQYAGVKLVSTELARFSQGSLQNFSPADLQRSLELTRASIIAGEWPSDAWVPAWLGWPSPAAGSVSAWATAASGWPFRCMVSHRIGPEAQNDVRGALRLDRSIKWPVRCLPLLPYWPGLALNALAYGLSLWCVRWAIPGLRRWRRLRRGGCPACGYDLHGSAAPGCPECGWGRLAIPA